MKKVYLALIIVLVIICSLFIPACSNKKEGDIVILYTTDVHCGISDNIGYAKLSAYVKDLKSTNKSRCYESKTDRNLDNFKNNTEAVHWAFQWMCLLLQQCLDGTDPGMPLTPGSDHPPTSFPVTTFRISPSATFSHWDHHHF